MELHLSRELADKRIFPAIDIMRSGTRHEELLYNADELDVVWRLRKMVADMEEAERMNRLITKLLQTKGNLELLFQVRKATE
jgi:transcription termination factor Rho